MRLSRKFCNDEPYKIINIHCLESISMTHSNNSTQFSLWRTTSTSRNLAKGLRRSMAQGVNRLMWQIASVNLDLRGDGGRHFPSSSRPVTLAKCVSSELRERTYLNKMRVICRISLTSTPGPHIFIHRCMHTHEHV